MGYHKLNNAAEELSLLGGSHDPNRNVRGISWSHVAPGFIRVKGTLRDDGNIPADRPRPRVHTLPFDVVVPERVSVWDLQVVIRHQAQPFA